MTNKIVLKKNIQIVGILFILLTLYVSLMSIDWFLKVYLNLNKLNPVTKAITLEQEYKKNIPIKAKEKRAMGYKPMFYPRYFNKTLDYNNLQQKYSILPLGVLPNTKYYVCDEGYGLTTFTSDKFGFWNSNEIYKKEIDLMIIGDSVSLNGCLQENKTFIGALRNKFNVMNLSMGSNDPIHYASAAKMFIPHFKPKQVIMVFTRGDFIDHYSQKVHIYKKIFFDKNSSLFTEEKNSINFPDKYQKNLLNLLNDAQLLTEKNIGNYGKLKPVQKPSLTKRILIMVSSHYKLTYIQHILFNKKYLPFGNNLALKTLNNSCIEFNCVGTIIYIPGSYFWRPDSRQIKHAYLLKEKIDDLEKIKFLDFTEDFANLDIKGYSPKGSHLSVLGNQRIFDKLINFLNASD